VLAVTSASAELRQAMYDSEQFCTTTTTAAAAAAAATTTTTTTTTTKPTTTTAWSSFVPLITLKLL